MTNSDVILLVLLLVVVAGVVIISEQLREVIRRLDDNGKSG